MINYRNQTPIEEEEEFEEIHDDSSSISSGDSDAESLSDLRDDEASSNQIQNQPLISQNSSSVYELSSLMESLPMKRGLSKYYDGKSQSFSSLAEVNCKEDLPKKESPFFKRQMNKSYACGLSDYNHRNKNISKKPSRGSCGNLMAQSNNNMNFMCRPPSIPMNKN
ncbi:hypothetical protein LUZ60_008368 [Juncus effusus]|nr:hypothetical protein LUZ60_008368 [Juncus effusus]